jgi:multidrug resistance efflux pump
MSGLQHTSLRIVAGLGLLALLFGVSRCAMTDEVTVEVERANIVHGYAANGRIESERVIELMSEVQGRILGVHVEEGDSVEKGRLLVTLDSELIEVMREEARYAALSAEATLDQVRRGPRPERIEEVRSKVAELEGQLAATRAQHKETLRGPRAELIRDARAQHALADAERRTAERQVARSEALGTVVASGDLDEHRRRLEAALAQVDAAAARLDRLENGATEEERTQSQASVTAAAARLDQARAVLLRLEAGATEEELRVAEADSQRAQASLEQLEVQLSRTQILCPVDRGVVLRRYLEPGEVVHPRNPTAILVIADLGALGARIEVEEGDVYKLRVGQAAEITSDSYVGRSWTGKVERIAPLLGRKAFFTDHPKEKVDVKVREAWLSLDGVEELPYNVPIEARVVDVLCEDVLVVPASVLGPDDTVELEDGSQRTLKLGARDDGFVEVLEGLAEGDRLRVPERLYGQ